MLVLMVSVVQQDLDLAKFDLNMRGYDRNTNTQELAHSRVKQKENNLRTGYMGVAVMHFFFF